MRLYVRDSALMQGLGRIRSTLQSIGGAFLSFGRSMAGISLAMSAPLAAAITHFTRYGSTVADMAVRTGLTTNAVSELGYAAEQSGSSLDELESSMRRMSKTVDGARNGTASAQDAFRSLGISVADLPADPAAQLEMIADAIQRIQDPTRRAAATMAIFGKSGTAMLPMLADGAEGLRKLRREAEEVGQSLDAADVAAADRLGDAWDKFKSTISGSAFSIGVQLAPALENVLDIVSNVSKEVGAFIKKNGDVIQSSVKWAIGIGAVGGGLMALGGTLKIVGSAAGMLSTAFTPVLFLSGAIRNRVSALGSVGKSIGKSFSSFGREVATTFSQVEAAIAKSTAAAASAGAAGARIGGAFATGFTNSIGSLSGRLAAALSTGGAAVMSAARRVAGVVADPSIGAGAFRAIAAAAQSVADRIRGAAMSARRGWTGELGMMTANSSRLFFSLGDVGRRALNVAINPSQWVAAARSAVTSSVAAIRGGFSSAFASIRQNGPAAIRSAFSTVSGAASRAASASYRAFAAASPRMAAAVTTSLGRAFRSVGRMATAAASGATRGLSRGLGGAVGGTMGAVAAITSTLGAGVVGSAGAMLGQVALVGPAIMALLNPFTLLAAAIGGGVMLWVRYSDAGKAAFARIMSILEPFLAIFRQTWQGVSDAIAAGDLKLAFQVAMAGAKVAVLTALDQINGYFRDSGNKTLGTVLNTISAVVGKLAKGNLQGAWQSVVNAMKAIWTGLKNWVLSGLKSIVDRFNAIRKWAAGKILEGAFGGEMAAEQARRDKLEQEQFTLKAKPIREEMRSVRQQIEVAQSSGDTAKVEELTQRLDELRQKITDLANAPDIDLMAEAKTSISDQMDAGPIALGVDLSITDVNKKLDELKVKAQADADAAATALADDVGDGAAMASDALADARKEFDLLRGEAGAAKMRKDQKDKDEKKDDGEDPGFGRAAREQATATFSAAALARIGGGGDVPKMTLAQIKALTRQQKEDNKLMKAGQDMLIRVARESGIRFAR